jgi:Domain of unknown function (DUF4424)
MRWTMWVAAALTIGAAADALANDSTAALGAGGVLLTQSADIRMASEDLFVSRELIRVRYQFVNDSTAPVTTEVAFPLPDADMEMLTDSDVDWPTKSGDNFIDFRIMVDGRPVTPVLERKAFLKGTDVTVQLMRLGVPLSPRGQEVVAALDKMGPAVKQELARLKLANVSPDFVQPLWTVKYTYHWRQTFPPGLPLAVEHTYKPIVGASFLSATSFFETPGMLKKDWYAGFCIDDGTQAGLGARLKALRQRDGGNAALMQYIVDYVLTTGRNWKGPIGAFRLTLDKGKPENVISFCMDGVRKAGPTTFVIERRNFEPDKDLSVMIFEAPRD